MKCHKLVLNNMNDDYEYMKENILSYYVEDFELEIETKTISNYNYSMVYNFSLFLLELKQKPRYLKKTTIYIYSNKVYNLLYLLFTYLCYPLAPVNIILNNNNDIYLKTFYP